jgi:predicted RNA-binding Zn-ribbon protein involved in translation (DUF1610 family)
MLTDRKEVMWCVDCGVRFTQEEIKGWGCPNCGSQGVRCDCDKDMAVEINWHELRILVTWAEYWAQQCHRQQCAQDNPRNRAALAGAASSFRSSHAIGPGRGANGRLGTGTAQTIRAITAIQSEK